MYEHEKKKHRETDELRREEAALQQETQRLRQVPLDFWLWAWSWLMCSNGKHAPIKDFIRSGACAFA